MKRLKADLERVKSLTEITRKRELRKSEQADVINDVLSHALFPHEPGLRLAFERISGYIAFDISVYIILADDSTGPTETTISRMRFRELMFLIIMTSSSTQCAGTLLIRSWIDTSIGTCKISR